MPSAQHVMLAVHCKRTEQLDVKAPILSYIRATYSDAEAEDAADDLAAVQAQRNELVTAQSSATGAPRKEALLKCALFVCGAARRRFRSLQRVLFWGRLGSKVAQRAAETAPTPGGAHSCHLAHTH